MGIIKSNQAPAAASPFSMADIEAAARKTLLHARAQAERLLIEAQDEARRLKEEAVTEGRAEGREEGLSQGLEEGRRAGHDQALNEHRPQLTQLVQSLSAVLQAIESSRRELEASAAAEVAGLAVAIARRIVKIQATADPDVLRANLNEALALVVGAADVRIHIHPAQMESMETELPRLKLQWPNLKHLELVGDDSVAPGGCRLATAQGRIDGDLDAQLDRIAKEAFGDASADGH